MTPLCTKLAIESYTDKVVDVEPFLNLLRSVTMKIRHCSKSIVSGKGVFFP